MSQTGSTGLDLSAVRGALVRSAAFGYLGGMPVDDQVEHALGFGVAVEGSWGSPPNSVVDLGSGGGVPGLILAACWPSSGFTLLDANERRTSFLAEEIDRLGWSGRVEVVRARAELAGRDPALTGGFEVVVARSFGAPAVTAECAARLLVEDGVLVVSEPPLADGAEDRDRWNPEGLALLGLEAAAPIRFRDRYGYQVIRKVAPTPDRYPRRVGIPTKRPLF